MNHLEALYFSLTVPASPSFIVPYSVSPYFAEATTSLFHSVDALTSRSKPVHMSSFHLSTVQLNLPVSREGISCVNYFELILCKRFHLWGLYWRRAFCWKHHFGILSSIHLGVFWDSDGVRIMPCSTKVWDDASGYERTSQMTWMLPQTFLTCKVPTKI